MTTTYHTLTPELFDRLATGGGGTAAVEVLCSVQLSRHLLLTKYLLDHWPGPSTERDAIAAALDLARQGQPDRFADVLGAPLVGAWAAITARAHRRGQARWEDFAHLAAVAAVACAAAGVDVALDVPVRDGVVSIPGTGAATVDGSGPGRDGHAEVCVRGGRLTVLGRRSVEVPVDRATAAPGWRPVRHLVGDAAGQRISLALDDLDPYRHGHHAPPAGRLSPDEFGAWQALFVEAWGLLTSHLPDRAAELTTGLRTLVPLRQDEHAARSATIRHAFGVFGLSRPPSAAEFAVTLVHEFQHSKLSALLDLTPLTDPADTRLFFAPWRTDARPLSGLLQGIYAFVGVIDTWRALRHADGLADLATAQFAEARLQVDRALSTAEGCGALTPAGDALITHLRQVVDAMLQEAVPAPVARAAEDSLARTWRRWRERNSPVA